MDSSQHLVDAYLERALDQFDTNYLSPRLIRRLSEEVPGLFLNAALRRLNSGENSGAMRFLSSLAVRHAGMFEFLTSPESSSRDEAVNLFRRFLAIDPSFDVRLAERLPNRRESNLSDAFDSKHSTRALDILDQTSRGRRLLPILGHLPTYRDTRISAKATLFVGRRLQSPAWTKKQLRQSDHRVRANAIESLWGLDSPAAVRVLEECIEDANNRVFGNSLLGLHILGRGEAEREALDVAIGGEPPFRSTAAWILGRIASPDCQGRLTEMVRFEHPLVRSTALRSLLEIRRAEARIPQPASISAPEEIPPVTVEKVIETIYEPSFDIRLDGSTFKVR